MCISDWSSDVCSSDLLGPDPVPLGVLARWPIITYPRNTRPYITVREMMTRSDFPQLRMYGNASLSTIVRMTLDGIGVSAIPPVVIRRELSEKRLRLVRAEQNLPDLNRSEEHTSELQSLMRISYAVFCLKKKNHTTIILTPR